MHMGSYRGKVTDDVIGFKPSTHSRTEYGVGIYGDSFKKSKHKPVNKLKHRLDKLLDEDAFIEDLLYFNDNKYIPIEYDESNIINSNFEIFIDLNEDFKKIWENIKLKNEKHIFDFEFSNIYIAFGFIKYEDYLFPLCFIPVNFIENGSELTFYPNNNINISLNYCISDELYNIDFPSFNGNIIDYIHKIVEISEINFLKKAYIGNFNLNNINCCNDLNCGWDATDKLELFFKDEYILEPFNVVKLNNELASDWPDLDFKLNNLNMGNVDVLIKNLMSNGNSIVICFDKFQRDSIKNRLYLSNLDDLTIDYSTLSEDLLYEISSSGYIVNTDNIDDFSKLNEELIELEECRDAINRKYSQLDLTPKDIKRFKNKYYSKIKDIPHDFPIKNAKTYKSSYINKLKSQLINVVNKEGINEDINLYLNEDFFDSGDYNIFKNISNTFEDNLNTFMCINNQLSETYTIKKFDNLNEVIYLENLNVLEKSNKFIDENDRFALNNLLKLKLSSITSIEDNNNESIQSFLDRYEISGNIIETIDGYIKYSELIDFTIFDNETLVTANLHIILKDLSVMQKIYSYLLKQLDYIETFYNQFKCFESPKGLGSERSIANLLSLANIFKRDLEMLEKFNEPDEGDIQDINVKNYFNLWKSGEIKKDLIEHIFSYNLYNSILTSFLEEFEYIDEEKIVSSYYEDRYKEVYAELKEKESDLFKQSIYSKVDEFNKNENAIKQKEDWSLRISKNEFIPLREVFANYKDYIFANKPVFMINRELVPLIFDNTFEHYFDYILISSDEDSDDLYYLPLFLRTKNKLITVGKGE